MPARLSRAASAEQTRSVSPPTHLPGGSERQSHKRGRPSVQLVQILLYPQDNLSEVLCHTPLAGPSGRRPPGMWRSPEPSPGSGGRPGLRATHAAWRRLWQPPKASLDHPGDVHFGLLKPISFIPWLRKGQNWPKGSYPNQTKPNVQVTAGVMHSLRVTYLSVAP